MVLDVNWRFSHHHASYGDVVQMKSIYVPAYELSMQRKSSHTETANGELVMVPSELLSNANSATTIYGD
jgi:hypothetical protein